MLYMESSQPIQNIKLYGTSKYNLNAILFVVCSKLCRRKVLDVGTPLEEHHFSILQNNSNFHLNMFWTYVENHLAGSSMA